MKTRPSATHIYKYGRAPSHVADDSHKGPIAPTYRGFVCRCLAAELPRVQRQINEFWDRAYFQAQTEAQRRAVVDQEWEWRSAPREWT
jgi:hypothetical protein